LAFKFKRIHFSPRETSNDVEKRRIMSKNVE
jgi:hypothetical protein